LHACVNIHVSSNSSPSMQRPWRLTHCGGMGQLFKKCWSITQNTPPLWNLIVARGVDMKRQTWRVIFRWNHVKLTWAFINIMNVIHQSRILQNNLSNDNVIH
jgi:hypothetical protein